MGSRRSFLRIVVLWVMFVWVQSSQRREYDDYGGYPSMEVFTRRMGSVGHPPARRSPVPSVFRQKKKPPIRRHWTSGVYDTPPYDSLNAERKGLFSGVGSDILLASLPFVFAPLVGMLMAPLALPSRMAAANLLAARAGTPVLQRGKRDLVGEQDDFERMRQRMVARYMRCSGLLGAQNHCVEKLACNFAAFDGLKKSKRLEREVTAMLITNIFHNPHINESFKNRMKKAAREGKEEPTSCPKFHCAFDDTVITQSRGSATQVSSVKSHANQGSSKRRKKKQPSSSIVKENGKLPKLFELNAEATQFAA